MKKAIASGFKYILYMISFLKKNDILLNKRVSPEYHIHTSTAQTSNL